MKPGLILGLALLIAGCGNEDAANTDGAAKHDEAPARSGLKGTTMGAVRSGNPAAWEGVKVYRPKKLKNVKYSSAGSYVKNIDNGDALVLRAGQAGSVGQYTYSNEKTGLIAYGGYYEEGGGVYRVASLMSEHGGPHLSRSDFDISRLAELFRARMDAALPDYPTEVLVVDSRPATPDDINPRTGMPRDKR